MPTFSLDPNMTDRLSTRFARRSVSTALLTLLAIASVPESAAAQNFNLGGFSNNRGYHQPSARRNMVRHGNNLFAAVVQQDGKVIIRRKVDDVTSPWVTLAASVNSATTGHGPTRPTTTVAMALARAGYLHITWGRYYYPSYFKQYYRCYKISTGTFTHAPQDISSLVGASLGTRTDSMSICVDAKDNVYMTAQNGTQSWRSRLLMSNFTSFPTGLVAELGEQGIDRGQHGQLVERAHGGRREQPAAPFLLQQHRQRSVCDARLHAAVDLVHAGPDRRPAVAARQ